MIKKMIVLGILIFSSILVISPNYVNAAATSIYSPVSHPAGYLNSRDTYGNLIYILGGSSNGLGSGGINADLLATNPGEYCNYYTNSSDRITATNGSNLLSITGFNPSGALTDWQVGSTNSNVVCQTSGGAWGYKMSGVSNNCTPLVVCGMHRFVRFNSDIRPWTSTSVPSTALSFSMKTTAGSATLANGGGVTGYFCPILKDVTTGRHIEYCFVKWRTGTGFPGATFDCANTNPTGSNVDIVWSNIGHAQNWVTLRPGSGNTTQSVPSTIYHAAAISPSNILSVISLINSSSGCDRTNTPLGPNSTNLQDYRIIGFEDGIEGGGFTALGGSVSQQDLSLSKTSDTLYPGDRLLSGQSVYDYSGRYKLEMQADGNLVMTDTTNPTYHPWYSNTFYSPGGAYAEMQGDGNFVIYRPDRSPLGNTGTSSSNNLGSYAILQPDGNFVLYAGNSATWSSAGHAPNGF